MMNEDVLNEARRVISSFFCDRRKELKISQAELAEMTGMGIATIKRFESGKFWINMKQMLMLCQALDLRPFFEGKESDSELNHSFGQALDDADPRNVGDEQMN